MKVIARQIYPAPVILHYLPLRDRSFRMTSAGGRRLHPTHPFCIRAINKMFSNKLTLAITMMSFCIGHVIASVPRSHDARDKRAHQLAVVSAEAKDPRFGGLLPRDVMKLIMEKAASNGTNPRHLASVCRWWHDVMRENNLPKGELKYSAMNQFMQECMLRYWERRFYDGAILFRPTPGNDQGMITLDIASLKNPFCDTFDLSTCGDRSTFVVLTTDIKRFFEYGGKNQGRVVILFMLHGLAEQQVKSTSYHPFERIMDGWDPDKAPVGIVLRLGNHANSNWFDYVTGLSLAEISSKNLFVNWKSGRERRDLGWAEARVFEHFSCSFINQNLELETTPKG